MFGTLRYSPISQTLQNGFLSQDLTRSPIPPALSRLSFQQRANATAPTHTRIYQHLKKKQSIAIPIQTIRVANQTTPLPQLLPQSLGQSLASPSSHIWQCTQSLFVLKKLHHQNNLKHFETPSPGSNHFIIVPGTRQSRCPCALHSTASGHQERKIGEPLQEAPQMFSFQESDFENSTKPPTELGSHQELQADRSGNGNSFWGIKQTSSQNENKHLRSLASWSVSRSVEAEVQSLAKQVACFVVEPFLQQVSSLVLIEFVLQLKKLDGMFERIFLYLFASLNIIRNAWQAKSAREVPRAIFHARKQYKYIYIYYIYFKKRALFKSRLGWGHNSCGIEQQVVTESYGSVDLFPRDTLVVSAFREFSWALLWENLCFCQSSPVQAKFNHMVPFSWSWRKMETSKQNKPPKKLQPKTTWKIMKNASFPCWCPKIPAIPHIHHTCCWRCLWILSSVHRTWQKCSRSLRSLDWSRLWRTLVRLPVSFDRFFRCICCDFLPRSCMSGSRSTNCSGSQVLLLVRPSRGSFVTWI